MYPMSPNSHQNPELKAGQEEQLLLAARRAAAHAYAPYSGFAVGCALRCREDGALFVGCNVENASYGLTLCAERAAVAAAVASGRRDFEALALYASGREVPLPCGACRQFLAEFAADLILIASNGCERRTLYLRELLPHPFRADSLLGPERRPRP